MAGVDQAIGDNVRVRRELQVHILARRGLDTKKPIRGGKAEIADLCVDVSVSAALGLSSHQQSLLAQLLTLCLDQLLLFKVRCEKGGGVLPLLIKPLRSLHVPWVEDVAALDRLHHDARRTCSSAQEDEMLLFLGRERSAWIWCVCRGILWVRSGVVELAKKNAHDRKNT